LHTLPTQTSPAAHVFPHAPQLFTSVVRSRHTGGVPHASSPAAQLTTHEPALQISPDLQAIPHAPQFRRSVERSAQ
jgi:hypothetical protein